MSSKSVKYYLDKGAIYYSYFIRAGHRTKLSTKEYINLKDWDTKKQRVKSTYKHASKINIILDKLQLETDELRLQYKNDGKLLTSDVLKLHISNRLFGQEDISVYKNKIDSYLIEFLEGKNGKVTPSTKASYNIKLSKVFELITAQTYADINRLVISKLQAALRVAGYKTNYINNIFKVFRDYLNLAMIDGYHSNIYYQSPDFMVKAEDVDTIYLTTQDLDIMYEALPTLNAVHRNAMIIFLRGCLTGQRHQTYRTYKAAMIYEISGVKMISLKHGKTKANVSIPCSDRMLNLMSMATHDISQQKLNDYIKEAAIILGINNAERITSHTARRTFATNMVLAGVDITRIMKITGHKTEKEFRKYVRIDSLQSAISTAADVNRVFGGL